MSGQKEIQVKQHYILYKIYSENCLLYIGRTKQPLQRRLHGHFFKAPMMRAINIECVTKIEYAELPTEADMYVWEVILINQLKPPLNRDDKAHDALTLEIPPLPFQEYECKLMDKWKEQIRAADARDLAKKERKLQLERERANKRKEIYSRSDVTPEKKQELYYTWLEEYYEPIRNELF